jgi:hypothetical protein
VARTSRTFTSLIQTQRSQTLQCILSIVGRYRVRWRRLHWLLTTNRSRVFRQPMLRRFQFKALYLSNLVTVPAAAAACPALLRLHLLAACLPRRTPSCAMNHPGKDSDPPSTLAAIRQPSGSGPNLPSAAPPGCCSIGQTV